MDKEIWGESFYHDWIKNPEFSHEERKTEEVHQKIQ